MDIVFEAHADHGHRVVSIKVGDKEITDDGHYTFAGCEREGEPIDVICRHRHTHGAEVLPYSIHEALHRYLESNPMISPRPDGREKARDLPPTVFSTTLAESIFAAVFQGFAFGNTGTAGAAAEG
jgi:5'-nucleotidase